MNKSTNRHMNIFNSYQQNGSIPIENNISRGLAIVLQEYPSLLMLFLSKINEKQSNDPIQYPHGDYVVDFQKKADDFEYVAKIVGVTLTPEKIDEIKTDHINPADRKYITDISILYDDTLLFIEVKRTDENCRRQLKEQIEKYKLSQNGSDGNISDHIVDFTWTEIVELLQQHKRLFDGNHDRLCEDYLSFLVSEFPSWAPVEHLTALSEEDEQAICSRLNQIKEESSGKDNLIYGRTAILLTTDYVSECNLGYDRSFKTENGTMPCVTIGMWPADTGRQYWCLRNKLNREFFENRYVSLDINSTPIRIRITPYIKFSHWRRGIIWLHMKEDKQNHIKEWLELSDLITGRKNREDWENLKSKISSDRILFSEEAKSHFLAEFNTKFQEKKSYVDVSCGFEVKAYIPFEKAQKLDHASMFAELLAAYLKKMEMVMVNQS